MTTTNKYYKKAKEGKTTDVWLTPQEIIDALGPFDLDPCCPNNLPWKTANIFYSLENGEDGLALPWHGRVWLNPPYSNWVPFLEKLKLHKSGLALIFARTETKGFFNQIWDDAHSVFFFRGRIKFVSGTDFKSGLAAPCPSVLVSFSHEDTDYIKKSGLNGKLVIL